jgi:hypothetical protein
MIVLLQLYRERNPERAAEIFTSVRMNLCHPEVDRLIDLDECAGSDHLPKDILEHPKFEFKPMGKRFQFQHFFEWSNSELPKDSIVCLINGDVFMDPFSRGWPNDVKKDLKWNLGPWAPELTGPDAFKITSIPIENGRYFAPCKIEIEESSLDTSIVFCLSRMEAIEPKTAIADLPAWTRMNCDKISECIQNFGKEKDDASQEKNFTGTGSKNWIENQILKRCYWSNSQDAWIWNTPIAMEKCNFFMGDPGCDNAIAERVMRAGRIPVNRGDIFRVVHYDHVRDPVNNSYTVLPNGFQSVYPEETGQLLLPRFDFMYPETKSKSTNQQNPFGYLGMIVDFSNMCKISNRPQNLIWS